jgi:hypothetical protein
MKRYLIFAALGPLLGGFWLLLTSTITSGYWSHPLDPTQVAKLVTVFFKTLQYTYLVGVLPALMIGAVDDILFHIKRIGPVLRMLLVAGGALSPPRGPDSGPFQFIMYGLVGFIPGAISSWLVHKFVEEPQPAPASTAMNESGGPVKPAA